MMKQEAIDYLKKLKVLKPEELARVIDLSRPNERKFVTKKVQVVMDVVCEIMEVKISDILRKDRNRKLVDARQVICYFIRTKDLASLNDTAKSLHPAIKDHTTVIHGVRCVQNMMATYPEYKQSIDLAESIINSKLIELEIVELEKRNFTLKSL